MQFAGTRICWLSELLVALVLFLPTIFASNTPYIPNSFYFDYNDNISPPVPVTEQCQTINIMWSRSTATGPNPVAPYYLHIFTSAFIVPFIIPAGSGLSFQWPVPFAPGTLYQICMFDSLGNSGGCQAMYSMIAPRGSTTPPTCQNVTFPAGAMDVTALVSNGRLSQFGWIPTCTDISVTPQNGTPPYTFTIAPTLHPPYIITSSTRSAMNWTVSLSWASPFFISVVDSIGNGWANGPLHSGMGTSSDCLGVPNTGSQSKPFPKVTVASAIGSAVGGLIVGGIVVYFFLLSRFKSKPSYNGFTSEPMHPQSGIIDPRHMSTPSHYASVPSVDIGGPLTPNPLLVPQYQIEPFSVPTEDERRSRYRAPSTSNMTEGSIRGPRSEDDSQGETSSQARGSTIRQSGTGHQVYVVHHDGGRAPFEVFAPTGATVQELPPGYPGVSRRSTTAASMEPSDESIGLPYEGRRQPGPLPRKGSSSYYTS